MKTKPKTTPKTKPRRKPNTRVNGERLRPTFRPLWVLLGQLLEEEAVKQGIIRARGKDRRELAKKLKAVGTLDHVVTGALPIPKADIERWARRLRLKGRKWQLFVMLGWLGHTPPHVADALLRLDKPLVRIVQEIRGRSA